MTDQKPPPNEFTGIEAEPQTLVTAQPIHLNVKAPIARMFLLNGQFFDIPLTQGWPAFMTNLLTHRGFLCDNAWIPEQTIRLILVNPDSQLVDPNKMDPSKVVQFPPKP